MTKKTIDDLVDKYGSTLAQTIPMTTERQLYINKVLADMLAETIEIVTKELQEVCYNAVVEELKKKGLLEDE